MKIVRESLYRKDLRTGNVVRVSHSTDMESLANLFNDDHSKSATRHGVKITYVWFTEKVDESNETPENSIEEARKHHKEHGDMDGETCLLNKCALHYVKSIVSKGLRTNPK